MAKTDHMGPFSFLGGPKACCGFSKISCRQRQHPNTRMMIRLRRDQMKQYKMRRDKMEQEKMEQEKVEQDVMKQDEMNQDEMEQDKKREDELTRLSFL